MTQLSLLNRAYGDCYNVRTRWRRNGAADMVFSEDFVVVVLSTLETCAFLEIF